MILERWEVEFVINLYKKNLYEKSIETREREKKKKKTRDQKSNRAFKKHMIRKSCNYTHTVNKSSTKEARI